MDARAPNLFQRLTRRWDAVHPYNAAQVLCVRGRVSASAAADAWADSLRALGLGSVRVQTDSRFEHIVLNGQMSRYPLRQLDAATSLEQHLSNELNRPFDDPAEPPFRPFLLESNDDCRLGLVYQHWVGDSVSVRLVLREWFVRLFDPSSARNSPLDHDPRGYWRLFGARSNWRLDETVLSAFRSHMRHRRVRKVRSAGPDDYPVRVLLREAPAGLISRLKEYAAEEGVRLHDVLLAAVAVACDRFVPSQPRKNRPDLSVGSIIDLRRHAPADLSDSFGLFLGFTDVVCRPHDLSNWQRLLRTIAAQNSAHRRGGIAQASMAWMWAALAINPLVPDRNLYRFYRKELPMAGGLSNVTLNDSWAARYHPDPLREYLRVSPTGPLVPLVFSTTTLGDRLFVAMTHRQALLEAGTASEMCESFVSRLCSCSGVLPLSSREHAVSARDVTDRPTATLPGQDVRPPAQRKRPMDQFAARPRRSARKCS